jgi:RNA polymerase sigma-70 factor (ECF subfamily)
MDYRRWRDGRTWNAMRTALWTKVEAFLPQLWRIARSYEANPSIQEDLLQEILLAAWESLPALRDPEHLRSYVLRIAHNIGATHIARAVRIRREVSIDDETNPAKLPFSPDDAQSRGAQLMDAVRRLPLPLRQVISLQLEGLSYQEIADVLDIDANNVGVRAHRAKKLLQELFDESR